MDATAPPRMSLRPAPPRPYRPDPRGRPPTRSSCDTQDLAVLQPDLAGGKPNPVCHGRIWLRQRQAVTRRRGQHSRGAGPRRPLMGQGSTRLGSGTRATFDWARVDVAGERGGGDTTRPGSGAVSTRRGRWSRPTALSDPARQGHPRPTRPPSNRVFLKKIWTVLIIERPRSKFNFKKKTNKFKSSLQLNVFYMSPGHTNFLPRAHATPSLLLHRHPRRFTAF